jgi:hypothetical protein
MVTFITLLYFNPVVQISAVLTLVKCQNSLMVQELAWLIINLQYTLISLHVFDRQEKKFDRPLLLLQINSIQRTSKLNDYFKIVYITYINPQAY